MVDGNDLDRRMTSLDADGSFADRVLRAGVGVAIVGALVQTVVHAVNFAVAGSAVFSVNGKHIPFASPVAWAHASMIVLAGFGAVIIAMALPRRRGAAYALAGILVFLSLDEAVVIHERIARSLLHFLGLSQDLNSLVWPMLYAPIGIVAGVLLWKIARDAPGRIRRVLLFAVISLAISVFAEMGSTSIPHSRSLWLAIEGGIEEAAEFVGWSLIAAALNAFGLFLVSDPESHDSLLEARPG